MAIGEQFAGLPIDMLIGAPLTAAAKASMLMAKTTSDFIDYVGFDEKGKVRTAAFMYQKRTMNDDGTSNLDELKVEVPMLAIAPIPNLQVDEVNVLFDMEVKQSERDNSETTASASTSISRKGWISPSFNISGSVSAHSSHTRNTDNSAKYHVDVRATNHGTPEGLARVLDMLAANVAPALVSSTLKDANGQSLSESARQKAEHLKLLREEISQIERRLGAAREGLNTWVVQLQNIASRQQNEYKGRISQKIEALGNDEKNEEERKNYSQVLSQIESSWSDFQNRTAELVELAASGGEGGGNKILTVFALKGADEQGSKTVDYGEAEGSCKDQFIKAQDNAVSSQRKVDSIIEELSQAKSDYSSAMAANTTSKPAIEKKENVNEQG
ncbi:MAG: DUF2589 domain-containing protein [Lachnospiraceae bacterium]|nr:DUF2589 domain-containing protein [Lachnospiraceae bacterium]